MNDATTMWPADQVERRPISELVPYARNARTHDEGQIAQLAASIREWGWTIPVLCDEAGTIIAGHGRVLAGLKLGLDTVPVMTARGWSEAQKRAYVIADNRLALNAGWDDEMLRVELAGLAEMEFGLDLLGFDQRELEVLLGERVDTPSSSGALKDRYLAAPFSVLNARDGAWQERKRAWLGLGIESELGRTEDVLFKTQDQLEAIKQAGRRVSPGGSPRPAADYAKNRARGDAHGRAMTTAGRTYGQQTHFDGNPRRISGTSVFDPVLCELAYSWFCPPGGLVLDPFAGGSVRGIVAAALGRGYFGVDLRAEQVAANDQQWADIGATAAALAPAATAAALAPDDTPEATPVERRGSVWVKRDDAYRIGGGCGGKVRSCWTLAQGATGLTTAGSRASPQVNIVAQIARKLGIPCRVHTPTGQLSAEVQLAQAAGAEVVQHKAGHNSVIIARAREDAEAMGWRNIPFGMECQEAVDATAAQVAGLPEEGVARLVIPVGSGMSLAGVLHGLVQAGRKLPVLAVRVGADPTERLDRWAPKGWRKMVELVASPLDYHQHAPTTELEGLHLDPIYEAKCLPFLRPDDLLWVVGLRASEAGQRAALQAPRWAIGDSAEVLAGPDAPEADFLFSCPPYGDLEVYSDDPRDLSCMGYEEFLAAHRRIIAAAAQRLRDDRFAAWVVGDFREPSGRYRNFVSETISAFAEAGLGLYNEAILVTMVGSLPIRAGKQFAATRKLGKTHQNVLVFVKGDARRATEACGPVAIGDLDALLDEPDELPEQEPDPVLVAAE